jgi:hypothetical protein
MPKIVTPQNRESIAKAMFGNREYLFDEKEMPKAVEPENLPPLEQIQQFRQAFVHFGGLFRPTDAACLLGIAYSTVVSYMATGTLESIEFFGVRWVTGNAVEHRIKKPRQRGRPSSRQVAM